MGDVYVTMGDPRGIGPEVALRALRDWEGVARVRLVGVPEVFQSAARIVGATDVFDQLGPRLLEVTAGTRERGRGGGESRSRRSAPAPDGHPRSWSSPAAGRSAGRAIERAVEEIRPGRGDVLVTGPIDKAALRAGGFRFPGHTEMLAALASTRASGSSSGPDPAQPPAYPVALMLVAGPLRVSLVTGHVPLRRVPRLLTGERLREVVLLTEHGLRTGFGLATPRLAVCGLNPHAGERGTLGREERRVVSPELERLRGEGLHVAGPFSADTIYTRAVAGEFDGVVALYHDQGMIPVKLHGFGRGVNVTLGLPFVRTSPDHGTAFDIAGRGSASADSFRAALDLAVRLGQRPEFVRSPVYKPSVCV